MNVNIKKISALAVAGLTVLSLGACTNTQKDSETKVDTATSAAKPAEGAKSETKAPSESKAAAAEGVTFENTFVKAKPAEKEMTGIFGTLKNNTKEDIKLTSFSTNTNAGKHEIHEVVNGVMQMKEDGITIPAGGEYVLKPGGDHLMIMDVTDPIEAGSSLEVTLNFSNGKSEKINSEVRTISSGGENYAPDGGVQGNSGMTSAPMAH
ncbi:copper chaperone PCu(A)C [Corynebacterium sp. H128]|uniref:copper chaperone PCu(A)C n=1 Tax=unclassified Corynebacterium TaxID=2624378 RepID=UPI0030A30662